MTLKCWTTSGAQDGLAAQSAATLVPSTTRLLSTPMPSTPNGNGVRAVTPTSAASVSAARSNVERRRRSVEFFTSAPLSIASAPTRLALQHKAHRCRSMSSTLDTTDSDDDDNIEEEEDEGEDNDHHQGSPAEVRWEAVDKSVQSVRIDVCNVAWSVPTTIAHRVPNDGSFQWKRVYWGMPITNGYYVNIYDVTHVAPDQEPGQQASPQQQQNQQQAAPRPGPGLVLLARSEYFAADEATAEEEDIDSNDDEELADHPPVLDPTLTTKIRRLTATRRRGDYLESLRSFAEQLQHVPLTLRCDVDTAQAFRDASREEIMLNGVCFVGDHRTEAFVAAVKRIVARHVDDADDFLAVTDRIMRGCSRTLSGSDSYFALHELFACPEILIKPRQTKLIPLDVTLGLDSIDRRFKCRIKSTNLFGLYRNEDIEKLLLSNNRHMDPFVAIDTLVVEIMDLTTCKSQRLLSIRTPPIPPSKLELEVEELF
ncbi:hypothetical protein ATCC90586_008952 [Pythium insidiosum]|nr:hypothetical protein ATCC90586_008952 [Pythium insidiosum]